MKQLPPPPEVQALIYAQRTMPPAEYKAHYAKVWAAAEAEAVRRLALPRPKPRLTLHPGHGKWSCIFEPKEGDYPANRVGMGATFLDAYANWLERNALVCAGFNGRPA